MSASRPSPCRARILDSSEGDSTFDFLVAAPEGGFFVLPVSYHPAWKARVDEQPASVKRVDGLIQGIWVSPGTYKIHFYYSSESVAIGCLFALGALIAGFFIDWRWRPRLGPLSQ